MKRQLFAGLTCVLIVFLVGCQTDNKKTYTGKLNPPESDRSIRYQYTSSRQITVGSEVKVENSESSQTMTQELELILNCKPVTSEDAFAYDVTIESAKVSQKDFQGETIFNHAVEELQGKPFQLTCSKDGAIVENSEFVKLLKAAADEESFHRHRKALLKEPDMLPDMVAMQYNLFASAAKIRPENVFSTNQKFSFVEPTPWPVTLFPIPDHQVDCAVKAFKSEDGIKKAKITESYALAEKSQLNMQSIYPGVYKMPGLLGFMRNYKFDSISGSGEKIYNMKSGQIEKSVQNYTVKGTASYAMPIKDSQPQITVNQTISYEIICD